MALRLGRFDAGDMIAVAILAAIFLSLSLLAIEKPVVGQSGAPGASFNSSLAAAPESRLISPSPSALPLPTADPASKWDALFSQTAPESGVIFPAKWNDLGPKLVSSGVLDYKLLELSMRKSGRPLTPEQSRIVLNGSWENLTINRENRLFVLNVLWALGLANDNPILAQGPLSNTPDVPRDRFASTGGWPLSRRNVNELISSSRIIALSQEQQAVVESVVKNTYRPCCDNPAFFPDCNHGMAALGLAEILASQNASEGQIMRSVLYANAYWFPQNYLDMAEYFGEQGVEWRDVNPAAVLGANYSSASGYSKVEKALKEKPVLRQGATSC